MDTLAVYSLPTYYTTTLASAYGEGKYSVSTYQNGNSSGSVLANTGFDLLLAASIAAAIVFVALLVRFWKKPAKKQQDNSAATTPTEQ